MSREKKSKVTGTLRNFRLDQPFMGFSTKFRSQPLRGSGAKTHSINYGGSCREELIWDTREYLQTQAVTSTKVRGTWRTKTVMARKLDVDHRSLKQPNVTHLWLNEDEDAMGDFSKLVCYRPCCVGRFLQLMDAFVGPLGVVLNPDRYQGNWWITDPEEAIKKRSYGPPEYRWYGIDNFFLNSPVLTSLVMGMFRQGSLLFQQGFDEEILKAVEREEVVEALTNSDPVLAMRILTKLRPWIEVPQKGYVNLAPFPKGYWERLSLLHRAIYKHGYEEVFEGDLQHRWNIQESDGKEADLANNPRYDVPAGPMTYWGTRNEKGVHAQRLAKLGK